MITTHTLRMVARRTALAGLLAAFALVSTAGGVRAATLVSPAAGHHYDWVMLRPTVAFDIAQGEQPKWVLVATDAQMTKTIRYCRQFTGVMVEQRQHWGCGAWAVGADAWGRDILRPLEWGKVYYWQLVLTDAAGKEAKSEVRSFAIDNEPKGEDLGELSDRIFDSAFGDGTELNLGAAAFANSAVRVRKAASERRSKNRFWINVAYEGGIDLRRSYVRIRSKAGTRYVPLTSVTTTSARANWVRSASERRLRPGRYEYQAFLRSAKNGAVVRSASRVIVVQTKSKAPARKVPAWTRL
jgi:hypothetical protein